MEITIATAGRMHWAYHRWATERVLEAAHQAGDERLYRTVGASFGSVFGVLRHIFQADWIWFSRVIGREDAQLARAPAPEKIAELHTQWMEVLENFARLLETGNEELWTATTNYKNSQGTQFETPLWQIVLHTVNHGTAHRGQVVALLRQLGVTPPVTDLIAYYRQVK